MPLGAAAAAAAAAARTEAAVIGTVAQLPTGEARASPLGSSRGNAQGCNGRCRKDGQFGEHSIGWEIGVWMLFLIPLTRSFPRSFVVDLSFLFKVWDWVEYRARGSPGPGAYDDGDAYKKSVSSGGSGKFNESRSKSDLEWQILRASRIPGVGDYDERTPPISGGQIAKTSGKSALEWAILRASQIPGAGDYEVDEATKPKHGGGRFNSSQSKSELDWILLRARALPAPGQYAAPVDKKKAVSGGKFNSSQSKSELEWAM